jgi:hypothetical protein
LALILRLVAQKSAKQQQQPTPGNVKEEAIALMNNCSKTLLKPVSVGSVLRLLKAAVGEAIRFRQFEKLALRDEVATW